ncbi:MAG: putative bifunctional diguanylate cyclase/phosphodiesterase [Gemmatimonadaceae bacterium]
MGRQERKYWIGRYRTDTILRSLEEREVFAAPSSHPFPQLSAHSHRPGQRRQRPTAARLEQEQLIAALEQALHRTKTADRTTHALLALDLDGFTRVQSSFGEVAADRLFRAVGQRVRECLGPNDTMARMGADEFHVLIECDGDAASAWRVAELMLHLVTAPYTLEHRQVALTACIGIALVRPHRERATDVIRDAFAAVHRAKNAGAARCALFDAGMHEATIEQLRLGAELRHAIDRNEFQMYYQPILRCANGELASLEALIRWQHPQRGCLTPSEFVAGLTRAELMGEVGRWTVGEVARQAVEWQNDLGVTASVAVNVSPRQLADPIFLPHAMTTIAAMGASPRCVIFEMTEEIELGEGDAPLRALRELRAAGFRVCLDDFGTGYSSLSYLQDLPVDAIKIDRALISGIDSDSRQRAIVGAIVRLAHDLDLDVVAEGVERRDQLLMLRTLGCDFVQGHYFAAPLSRTEMRAWLRA